LRVEGRGLELAAVGIAKVELSPSGKGAVGVFGPQGDAL
jgi:hypothetical protein